MAGGLRRCSGSERRTEGIRSRCDRPKPDPSFLGGRMDLPATSVRECAAVLLEDLRLSNGENARSHARGDARAWS